MTTAGTLVRKLVIRKYFFSQTSKSHPDIYPGGF